MESFTPWSALAGGLLIGTASAGLLLVQGRIAGISGIWSSIFRFTPGDLLWRVFFVLGLLVGGAVLLLMDPESMVNEAPRSIGLTALAGLLVGVGTRLGSGCTSGHGVCGISRFSPRSLVATLTFMFTGGVAAWLVSKFVLGVSS